MTEEIIKKIVKSEIKAAIDTQNKRFDTKLDTKLKTALTEQKDEFVREVKVVMEEFTSQMKSVAEYALGMHENHEKRIIALEEKVS